MTGDSTNTPMAVASCIEAFCQAPVDGAVGGLFGFRNSSYSSSAAAKSLRLVTALCLANSVRERKIIRETRNGRHVSPIAEPGFDTKRLAALTPESNMERTQVGR